MSQPVACLLYTSGLHLVFKAADRWVPGLDIGKVTGGWRDLTLSDVRYEQPGVAVKAGNLHLAVGLECLWNSSVCINAVSYTHLDVYKRQLLCRSVVSMIRRSTVAAFTLAAISVARSVALNLIIRDILLSSGIRKKRAVPYTHLQPHPTLLSDAMLAHLIRPTSHTP